MSWITNYCDTPPSVFDPERTRQKYAAHAEGLAAYARDLFHGGRSEAEILARVEPVPLPEVDDADRKQANQQAARARLAALLDAAEGAE